MKFTTHRMLGWRTSCLLGLVVILGLSVAGAITSAQENKPVGDSAKPRADKPVADAKIPDVSPPRGENRIPEIVGTWSRAESGTFSKLTIWPAVNREDLFFVEGADGNGLLKWKPAHFNFQGFFTFHLLGSRTAQAYLVLQGPKETRRLIISPFEDQRHQLLRSGFAKTERELDQKLSSDWTRVEDPAQPMPMTTVTVVKTQYDPLPIRELLRAKYREPPYRFFSNDTFRSVIVLAPAEVQEDIEVLIHKFDVKTPGKSNGQAALPNIVQQLPANQPQPKSRLPDTPAAKQLVEHLGAQESAAATQAATIRKLQANGLAEQFKTEIAGHQRELKNLLGTAFDLKLQLEELQVQELQARLSRLERQIGQRKELREKIIARRASELIDGDDLKWSSIATPKSREQVVTVPDGGTAVVHTPPAARTTGGKSEVTASQAINRGGKDEKVTVDLYGGAKVLPRISQNPKHGKLLQSLNAMTGVVTNFREVQVDDETVIVTAIVRDPSLHCQREMQRTGKESELKAAINAALKEAGVAVRWEEGSEETEATKKANPEAATIEHCGSTLRVENSRRGASCHNDRPPTPSTPSAPDSPTGTGCQTVAVLRDILGVAGAAWPMIRLTITANFRQLQ